MPTRGWPSGKNKKPRQGKTQRGKVCGGRQYPGSAPATTWLKVASTPKGVWERTNKGL
jgi:hypothetical protein